jgi:hypothetical protein
MQIMRKRTWAVCMRAGLTRFAYVHIVPAAARMPHAHRRGVMRSTRCRLQAVAQVPSPEQATARDRRAGSKSGLVSRRAAFRFRQACRAPLPGAASVDGRHRPRPRPLFSASFGSDSDETAGRLGPLSRCVL